MSKERRYKNCINRCCCRVIPALVSCLLSGLCSKRHLGLESNPNLPLSGRKPSQLGRRGTRHILRNVRIRCVFGTTRFYSIRQKIFDFLAHWEILTEQHNDLRAYHFHHVYS